MEGKHIQNFASFTEKLKQQRAIQEEEQKSGKQEQYAQFFKKLLQKYNVTSPSDLTDDKKSAFFDEISKGWDEGEGLTASGEEMMSEGRSAFLATLHTAQRDGSATFEFNGKTYKLAQDVHEEEEVEETNAEMIGDVDDPEEEIKDKETLESTEEVDEKKSKVEPVEESLAIAGGILLAVIGLGALRSMAKDVLVKIGANMEAEPWRLKEFVDKMVDQGKGDLSGKDASFVSKWQKKMHSMIEDGSVKTLNQLEDQMETSLNTEIFV